MVSSYRTHALLKRPGVPMKVTDSEQEHEVLDMSPKRTIVTPTRSRDQYRRFKTAWTTYAEDVVNCIMDKPFVPLIKRADADASPGLSFSTPEDAPNVASEAFKDVLMTQLEGSEECSLALSAMLYQSHVTWRDGDIVEIRTCADRRKWVPITPSLREAHLADLASYRKGYTRLIHEDMYGYRYKRGERNSRFVACGTAVLSEGQVLCCRCIWEELFINVDNNKMDTRTQIAINTTITQRSWYRDYATVLRTLTMYLAFAITLGITIFALEKAKVEVAVAVIVSGLSACYTILILIMETGTTLGQALTCAGSNECVGSHINMALGKSGKPLYDKGAENLSSGTYLVQDPDLLQSITMFVSAALCTRKMREVLRPEQSCAIGTNLGNKTLWDIVMTSKRIRNLGCLLTNKFYVVHTSSGLKAFVVNNASATARHTNWLEVTSEIAAVVEADHVVLG